MPHALRARKTLVVALCVALCAGVLSTPGTAAAKGAAGKGSVPAPKTVAQPRPAAAPPAAVPAARQVAAATQTVSQAQAQAAKLAVGAPASGPWGSGPPPTVAKQQAAVLNQPQVKRAQSLVNADRAAQAAGVKVIGYDVPVASRTEALERAAQTVYGAQPPALPSSGPWGSGPPPTVARIADTLIADALARNFRAAPTLIQFPPGATITNFQQDALFLGLDTGLGANWSNLGTASDIQRGLASGWVCNVLTNGCVPLGPPLAAATSMRSGPRSDSPVDLTTVSRLTCPANAARNGQTIPYGFSAAWCFDAAPAGTLCPGGSDRPGAAVPGGYTLAWCFDSLLTCPADTARAGEAVPTGTSPLWCAFPPGAGVWIEDPTEGGVPVFRPGTLEFPLPAGTVDPSTVEIVLTVDIPSPLRAGGRLREETVRILGVDLLCSGVPCTPEEARLFDLSGTLGVTASAATFRECTTSRSLSCEFQQLDRRGGFTATDGGLSGGWSRLAFFSPTPNGQPMRVTVTVDDALVDLYVPGLEEPVVRLDAAARVSVRTTTGATLAPTSGGYRMTVPVIGTVGS